jgi:hypothetical protein
VLFPPNHRFVPVSISGLTTPSGAPPTITITGITQDEALNGQHDGNTCPDANGVGTSTAQLRAERSGSGDGRFYHISFRADDDQGDACEGAVMVCVPVMRRPDGCIDQGELFDSTDPSCDGTCSGTCAVTRSLESIENGSCLYEALPSRVLRRIAIAHKLVTRVGEMRHPRAGNRLLGRAARMIREARSFTAKAQASEAISPACGNAAGDVLDRAGALADQVSRDR